MLDEAITAFRKAIELMPDFAPAHDHLGRALHARGDLDGAIACYRQAIRLEPKLVGIFPRLGDALMDKGDLDGAIAAYRKSLEIDPPVSVAPLYGLGRALHRKRHHREAVRSFREALRVKPDWPEAQAALAGALKDDGQPAAAVEEYRKAFAAKPALADDEGAGRRHLAAGAAAQAGAGKGDGPADETGRAGFRAQALDWLRADLARWAKRLEGGKPGDRETVRERLRQWQRDPDLAVLRDPADLARLSADEREAWQKLWAEVAALIERAKKGPR